MKNPYDMNQAEIICALALELMTASRSVINPLTKQPFRMKFGFHSGPAVGGIVGNRNYQYCLFGDTINTASRVTTSSEPGKIHLSATSYELLKDSVCFATAYRGKTEMKGKGSMDTYWLLGPTETYLSLLEATRTRNVPSVNLLNGNKEEPLLLAPSIPTSSTLKVSKVPFNNGDLIDPMSSLTRTSSLTKNNVLNKMKEKNLSCPFSGAQL
ncbi:unnamed protein product [Adineta steineri]|uniref:Guanylate cyclase domain-containing protein n=1 Tax=Adineta steineri TaxID=433720 RepID=A0A818TIT0_9BILA|nr:unnamed protein product [Adineta steineri]CAF3685355.1 unnamed protein product [Adineta steineri]